jgi:ribosomal protein S18 acetylase RimI-like enzyme
MKIERPIHPDFQFFLNFKNQALIDLFTDLRTYLLDLYPNANELLYHTHALTTVFSISDKLSDAFCMLPIYTNHLNLGFNKGTLLKDPHQLLTGTGNLIRHIDVKVSNDYRNPKVKALILEALDFAIKDMDKPTKSMGKTISKIKIK